MLVKIRSISEKFNAILQYVIDHHFIPDVTKE